MLNFFFKRGENAVGKEGNVGNHHNVLNKFDDNSYKLNHNLCSTFTLRLQRATRRFFSDNEDQDETAKNMQSDGGTTLYHIRNLVSNVT